MMKKQMQDNNQAKQNTVLTNQLVELEALLEEKTAKKEKKQQSLKQYQQEFTQAEEMVGKVKKSSQSLKNFLRAIPAFLLGRRNFKQVYSKTYKRKSAANQLNKYKTYLYDLGFVDRALTDLQQLFSTTENRYLKQAIAWELALWHANKLKPDNAGRALAYLEIAIDNEKNPETLRKAAILKAECYDLLGEQATGKQIISEQLATETHADLFLAAANLEATAQDRIPWLNKTLRLYDLQEIALASEIQVDAYYRLKTDPIQREQDGKAEPKVSVIIPAYNSESGIRIAIESMLAQSWKTLEILVVDDCSTDDTAKVITEYATRDTRVKQLTTPKNSGPYIARNIALEEATGEFITINDADDWSHPEKIERQVKHLIENEQIIANTSEHARLTENLKPYRRGMPGKYIFSNMSSILFKREPVLEKVGYWDSVRFAADSEFKNRLITVFGKEAVVDVQTGPLSFPMHSSGSLTASSAFGYYGFLMGVRKEYAESYRNYHTKADSFYMLFQPEKRYYPVPEPMWPEREEKQGGKRQFDIVLISDYRKKAEAHILLQLKAFREMGLRTGLIQMGQFDLRQGKQIDNSIRELIDGENVQMLVYGEAIACDLLLINNPAIFAEKQEFLPTITPKVVRVIVNESPVTNTGSKITKHYDLRKCARNIEAYVHTKSKWYPIDDELRKNLLENHLKELKSIPLSTDNWMNEQIWNQASFTSFIEDWFVDVNPFKLE